MKKEFTYALLDREGNLFQSKEKFVPGGPPGFAGAGGGCVPTNAWRENPSDAKKLFLCNKYHFIGIHTVDPQKALHIVTFHSKGVPPDDVTDPDIPLSHEGMRLELIYKDFDLNITTKSKWDLEPFVDPITFERKFHLGIPGSPFFTITENGNIGIDETDPKTSLSITSSELGAKITLWDGGSATDHYGFGISNKAIPDPVPVVIRKLNYHIGDVLGAHVFYAGGKNGDGAELMRILGNGQVLINFSTLPSLFRFGVNGSGYFSDKLAVNTTTIPSGFHFAVEGKIAAREVRVDDPSIVWNDYILAPEYVKDDLDKVESDALKNSSLDGIPTTEEVKEKGIALGSMIAILVKKIEQIFLYLFDFNKEIKALKQENKALKNKNEALTKKVDSFEKRLEALEEIVK